MLHFKLLISSVAAISTLLSATAIAQGAADAYPSRPVTFIVPLAPGGGADIDTRLFTQKLSENLHQQFVVDYKTGAGTTIGTAYVAKAAPDGYTVLAATGNFTVAPALYRKLSYDPIKDFAPVTMMNLQPSMLLAPPFSPIKSVTDYIAYARTHPGELNFGTTGVGSFTHLAGEWLHFLTKTKVTFVPYKGAGEILVALAGGQINVGYGSPQAAMALVRAGKLKGLGVVANERMKSMPDLPAVREAVPGYVLWQWYGVLAPAATPPAIVNKLGAELAKVAKSAEIVQRNNANASETVGNTPDEFKRYLVAEVAQWRKLVGKTGIKLDE